MIRPWRYAIIEAGLTKYDLKKPTQAIHNYDDSEFLNHVELASKISDGILILDHRYGLIKPNDIIEPMDANSVYKRNLLKMTLNQAHQLRRERICIVPTHSVLLSSRVAMEALTGDINLIVPNYLNLGSIPKRQTYVKKLLEFFKDTPSKDFYNLKDGDILKPLKLRHRDDIKSLLIK